jgi:hypothetical protein
MNRSVRFLGPLGILGVGLLIAAAAVSSNGGTVGAQTAVMKVVPASQTVDIGAGNFTLEVLAEQVDDPNGLAAFEFKLSYDPEVIRFVGVKAGPFLGSTGRDAHCTASRHDSAGTEDIQFGCGTIAQGPPWGPTGSGLLATVTFAPRAAGTTSLNLKAEMAKVIPAYRIPDENIAVVGQGGSVTVVGSGPEPTPRPDEPTAIPIVVVPSGTPAAVTPPDYSWLAPEPGETPMTRPIDGMNTTGANTSSSSSSGGAAQGTAGGSPRAGEGPPEKDAAWWPMLIGSLLAAAGISLLPLAVHLRGASLKRRT